MNLNAGNFVGDSLSRIDFYKEREKETMKKVKGKILGVIGVLAVFGIYYYAALPAF